MIVKFINVLALLVSLTAVPVAYAEEQRPMRSQTNSLSSASAQTLYDELKDAPHSPLSDSTPQLAALVKWHRTLLSNDFPGYKEVEIDTSGALTGVSDDELRRRLFEDTRAGTPQRMVITTPYLMPSGNYLIHAVGCKRGSLAENFLAIRSIEGRWRIFGGVWSLSAKNGQCHE